MKNRRFPYGYEMINGEIVLCKAEADIVRTIFRDYIGGKALKDIADRLTGQAVEYLPGESRWNKSRIKRMIEDQRYLGDETYPQIIAECLLKEANAIKSDRRTTDNYVVHSENKALIYAVCCAECGERLYHKTDTTRTDKESWYCKNSDCKTAARMNVDTLENEVTDILNRIIRNPGLADKSDVPQNTETALKVRRLENDIERSLEQIDFDKETIQNLILQCAAKRYETDSSQKHITDRLKADFEKSSPLSAYSTEVFSRTVTAVLLSKDGTVSLLLKNGNLIGKEQNEHGGTDSGNAEGGQNHPGEARIQRKEQCGLPSQACGGVLPGIH